MQAQLIQLSVVVAGKQHNPSILNPDFLAVNGIVSKGWGWEVAETLTTPPFALVRYSSGVSVTVEFDKLQVSDLSAGVEPASSKVAKIAEAYVRMLPHVRYSAVGINLHSILEVESPESYVRERFIKSGPWHHSPRALAAAGVRLVYPLDEEARVTLSLDAGEVQRSGEQTKRKVVIANANFHRECSVHPALEKVAECLSRVPSDWSTYQDLLSATLS